MDSVQKQLREVTGVSALIYEQTCATELRRRRKRGQVPTPESTVVINELVCEGCGDCSVESNCLSVEPVETKYGTKRSINQSSCNKDYSCINGFCPSFVTVKGKVRKQPQQQFDASQFNIPEPTLPGLDQPYDLLITGVGGTGVITVAALITMAAHLEGKGSSVLDFTGFAQKFGPVLSFVRVAASPEFINQVRIDEHSADALLGCDVVVSSSPKASSSYRKGMQAVLNTAAMPTGDIVRHRDASLQVDTRINSIKRAIGSDELPCIDANALSTKLFGDTVFANMLMVGYAWQHGLLPISSEALLRAIELNGVAVEKNNQAFSAGRVAATKPEVFNDSATTTDSARESVDELIADRAAFLKDYQNARYAKRYTSTLEKFRHSIHSIKSEHSQQLTLSAARSLFKLMAYKDEYEVARLHTDGQFIKSVSDQFEEGFTVSYHMAPPLLPLGKDERGRPRKREFGAWMNTPMRAMAAMKILRGTPADIFSYTSERRMERRLIPWYRGLMKQCEASVNNNTMDDWLAVLRAPMDIRGYGSVKEQAVDQVKTRVQSVLDGMHVR